MTKTRKEFIERVKEILVKEVQEELEGLGHRWLNVDPERPSSFLRHYDTIINNITEGEVNTLVEYIESEYFGHDTWEKIQASWESEDFDKEFALACEINDEIHSWFWTKTQNLIWEALAEVDMDALIETNEISRARLLKKLRQYIKESK